MKTKLFIPHSPQSQHEHTLANTNLFVLLYTSYYLFCHGNHLTQQEHTFANTNIFFKILICVLDIFNIFDFYYHRQVI